MGIVLGIGKNRKSLYIFTQLIVISFIVCILMYINNTYHWVKGQSYSSRSKVTKSGQTCLIQYRLYITSSTFLHVSIAEPVFIVL